MGRRKNNLLALALTAALLSGVAPAARAELAAAADPSLGGGSASGPSVLGGFTVVCRPGAALKYADGVLTVYGGGVTVYGGGGDRLRIAGDAEVTLGGVEIAASGGPGIQVLPGAEAVLILAEGSVNHVTGADNYAGIEAGLDGDKAASVVLRGGGMLTARGGSSSAGIGGSGIGNPFPGDITIEGGAVTAQGGSNAAGIGTAVNTGGRKMDEEPWGVVTIAGGEVRAEGNGSGAGIGGGNHADSGKIVIEGGVVTASGASGIGSGYGSSTADADGGKGPGCYYAQIEIHGGTVKASGTGSGAGIGGAVYCDAVVTIDGGDVTAVGGAGGDDHHQGGAGIGGGYLGHGSVTVSGGTVVAAGGAAAAGIGSGGTPNANEDRGSAGRRGAPTLEGTEVVISGEADVTASGGSRGGAGVGGGVGADKVSVTVEGGSLRAFGGGASREGRGGAGIGSGYAGFSSGEGNKYFSLTETSLTLTGGVIAAAGGWGAAGIGGGAENLRADELSIAGDADVTAFADGARFALDTRPEGDEAPALPEGWELPAMIQGTFADLRRELDSPALEGLSPELAGESGAVFSMILPEGYRSFAQSLGAEHAGESFVIRAGGLDFAGAGEEFAVPTAFALGRRFAAGGFTDRYFLSPAGEVELSVTWDDRDDLDGSRRDAVFRLLRDGTETASAAAPAADGERTLRWDDLVLLTPDAARTVEYTVSADPPPGYDLTLEGADGRFSAVLSHVPETVSVAGALSWNDGGNADGQRPDSAEVILLGDGAELARRAVSPDGAWTYDFGELPLTRAGVPVRYALVLAGTPEYAVTLFGYDIVATRGQPLPTPTPAPTPEPTATPTPEPVPALAPAPAETEAPVPAAAPAARSVREGALTELYLWVLLLLASLAGAILLLATGRRKK